MNIKAVFKIRAVDKMFMKIFMKIRRMTIASSKDIDLHSKQYLGYRWLFFKNNLQHCTNLINGRTTVACKVN